MTEPSVLLNRSQRKVDQLTNWKKKLVKIGLKKKTDSKRSFKKPKCGHINPGQRKILKF